MCKIWKFTDNFSTVKEGPGTVVNINFFAENILIKSSFYHE